MSMLRFIEDMNQFDLSNFKKFLIDNQHIGWIHNTNIKHLMEFTDVFIIEESYVSLTNELNTVKKRTQKVAQVLKILHQRAVINRWRDEYYDVAVAYGSEVLMQIERSAAGIFGIKRYGVHANGYRIIGDELHLWVAKRSMQKDTYPGKLDQLVAGGFTGGGHTPFDIFIKEAAEEAGISKTLAKTAKSTGCISYTYCKANNKFTSGNIFVFDIETPEDFQPKAIDGEVDEFYLIPATELLDMVINEPQKIKNNCILVMIDFFIRHGIISSDHPDYINMAQKLHQ